MKPFSTHVHWPVASLEPHDNHLVRRLDSLSGMFSDRTAFEARLVVENPVVYEVYEIKRPEIAGELPHGMTVLHPGKIGDEYWFTKGHFHDVLDTAEIYVCLRGHGYMMMETPEGEWCAEELVPDSILYVPPCWAHRTINVGTEDLVLIFAYPGNAGHDYGTIETQGFRKLLVERDGRPVVIDNRRWKGGGRHEPET